MTYTIKEIRDWNVAKNVKEKWVQARPIPGPFLWRLREAWLVLNGKLDTLEWEDQ